ncbi:ABC transporter permease [Imperialibacter roseus]|uniref:ABC transporter permease n=1 Tax=Imperialibacter roseus TaxID=1324217 RepID=A0ABZ0ISR5_9BACT|nr:ABC transporter permease [Imperialibacter roseus]WOK07542.1 ABC transporter permease [Imperialibacter roseus]
MNSPPKYPLRFLRWFCREDYLDEIEGDLIELFEKRAEKSPERARRRFVWDVVKSFRLKNLKPILKGQNSNYSIMFQHYFKVSWRSIWKNKGYSSLNVLGLTLGISCAIVIALYVEGEFLFDRLHHQPENVVRVVKDFVNEDGSRLPDATTPPALAHVIRNELPEVEQVTRFFPNWDRRNLIGYGDKKFYEMNLLRVDEYFFDVFDFPFISGDRSRPFDGIHSMIITETIAKKYFGDENPVGKIVSTNINNDKPFVVSGVIKDVPYHSHFSFDFLIPFESTRSPDDNWNWSSFYTYVRLKPATSFDTLASHVQELVRKYRPQSLDDYYLQPLTDIHLKSSLKWELATNGDINYVTILIAIGLFVLVIAGVNYVNLVTAQAAKRAKEVGVRQAVGARKNSLIGQFLVESVLVISIAIALSFGVVVFSLPSLQKLVGYDLSIVLWTHPVFFIALPASVLLFGIITGIYPALYLSSMNPLRMLRGKYLSSQRGLRLRSGLVIFQFVMSVSLISGSLIISRQLNFLHEKKLGFNPENVVILPNVRGRAGGQGDLVGEMKKIPAVVNVARADGRLGLNNFVAGVESKTTTNRVALNFMRVDYEFLPTMQLIISEGRNFDPSFRSDSTGIILNETAAKQLGLQKPYVGQKLKWDDSGMTSHEVSIIAVVEDFHFTSFHEVIKPFGFILEANNGSNFLVRVHSNDLRKTIAEIETVWNRTKPDAPFEYGLQDKQFEKLYASDEQFQNLFSLFTTLAICIACLGLVGLIIALAETKTKEIGVRKVLGSSVVGIILLLSRQFVALVAVGFLIAVPIAWSWADYWLNGFPYRIQPGIVDFAISGLVAILMAFGSIGIQAFKAATANPVKSLRTE